MRKELVISKLRVMKNTFLFVIFFCLIVSVSFVSAAGPATEEGPMAWVWRILNFAILVFLLVKFAGKPLKNFLKQRSEMIEKSIKDAQEAKEIAKKALEEVEQRLKLKDKEVAEILEVAKTSGEEEQKRLIEDAERLKTKILEQAKANIEHEVKMAKEAIKAEAVEEAIKLSEEKIKNRLTREDHDKILQDSIKLLGARN
ncbi:MAG: F0F1 ATP synthase subunit B [Thermodesulfovibrionales bacterium]|nr:F0F1 ATP synthase subunit B [Thermodesulfovibrionales bacterium]